MAKVKSKKVVEYIWKLTEDEVGAIQKAMMSSDYYHSESLSDQGLDHAGIDAMVSAFKKFGIDISDRSEERLQ